VSRANASSRMALRGKDAVPLEGKGGSAARFGRCEPESFVAQRRTKKKRRKEVGVTTTILARGLHRVFSERPRGGLTGETGGIIKRGTIRGKKDNLSYQSLRDGGRKTTLGTAN